MKHILDKDFKYTPSSKQSVDYLRAKFARIRAQNEANRKEAEEKVKAIPMKRTA
jgi:hypothetical protein